jgi:hypothetical protein
LKRKIVVDLTRHTDSRSDERLIPTDRPRRCKEVRTTAGLFFAIERGSCCSAITALTPIVIGTNKPM